MATATHVQRVLDLLSNVRPSGDGWAASCPAHADRHPSLTVAIGTEPHPGAVLVHCHTGCSILAIVTALGITTADLFPDSTRKGCEILRRHVYRSESGHALYAVDRTRTRGRTGWRYVHPEDGIGWKTGRGEAPRVLYHLPTLATNDDLPIWLTEGERDADTLAARSLIATTVASGSWTSVDTSPFRDRRVRIVVDNDRTGWEKGHKAMGFVQRAGGLIEGVFRPGDAHKDLTAWIAEGKSEADLLPVDLKTEEPPCETWPTGSTSIRIEQYADPKSGLDYFTMLPKRLLHDAGASDFDVRVFGILDAKAGASGKAKLSGTAIAALTGRKDPRPIMKSLEHLTTLGLIEPGAKRGWWLVHNPARRPFPDQISSSQVETNKNPAKRHEHARSECTPGHVENLADQHDDADRSPFDDALASLHDAFPGSCSEPDDWGEM